MIRLILLILLLIVVSGGLFFYFWDIRVEQTQVEAPVDARIFRE
ncbi:MAG: hypothetical protein ACFBZ9_08730 [Sphingomonadales bacterium]